MRDHVEETLRIVRGGIDTFEEAVAWAIQTLDTRFSPATMVQLQIEQYMVLSDTETDAQYQWNVVVSGLVREE